MRKDFNKNDIEAQNYALRYLDSQLVDYMRFDINFIAPFEVVINGNRTLWLFAKNRDNVIITDNPKEIISEFPSLWWCKVAFPIIVQMFKAGVSYMQKATSYIEGRKQSDYQLLFPEKYNLANQKEQEKFFISELIRIGEARRAYLLNEIETYSTAAEKYKNLF